MQAAPISTASPVIPGDAELDFKKLPAPQAFARPKWPPSKTSSPLTGYIRGGVTLFGQEKPYPVYIDEEPPSSLNKIRRLRRSPRTQLVLSPDDYLRAAQALEVKSS